MKNFYEVIIRNIILVPIYLVVNIKKMLIAGRNRLFYYNYVHLLKNKTNKQQKKNLKTKKPQKQTTQKIQNPQLSIIRVNKISRLRTIIRRQEEEHY